MENFNLAEYRTSELSLDEMQSIVGGSWWSDFKAGFVEGFTWMFDKIVEVLTAQ